MNHDYAHCLDYSEKCPRSCFRGKLVREVQHYGEMAPYAFGRLTWEHMKGTEECKLYRRRRKKKRC